MKKPQKKYIAVLGEAIRTLRVEKKKTVAGLAKAAKVSKTTIMNIEHGMSQQMLAENAQRVAQVLGVPLSEIESATKPEAKNPALGALGLIETEVVAPDHVPFQSYVFDRDNQPIAYQWCDIQTESLTLSVTQCLQSKESRLVAKLGTSGKRSPMASNVALHPLNHTPRAVSHRENAIGFATKIVDNPDGEPLSVSVRLVDRKGREWVLGSNKNYTAGHQSHLFRLDQDKKWTPSIIPLTPYATSLHCWYLFRATSVDRSPNLRPDWSAVARIIIEFGVISPSGHPSAGNGEVWLSPIWVGTAASIMKRLPKDHQEGLKVSGRATRRRS